MKVRHALSRHRALLIMVTRAALTLPFVAGLTTITAPFSQANGRVPVLAVEDEQLLDDLERTAFQFFAEQTHPHTGLVRDRARADGSPSEGKASIAASGFAFDAWVIATERGWATRDEALQKVRVMLRFLVESAPRRHGFFYHFMEMDTGARAWNCEVSSIDTSLCLAGAIVAREYFQDPEVTELVNRLYGEIDWQWFLNEGLSPSLGWHDGHGFSRYRWRGFAEHLLMHLLGLGAPDHAFDRETWQAWERSPAASYGGLTYLQQAPLFIHQYSQAYFDLRERRDAYADYHHNSVLATRAHRQFCLDLRAEFPRWSEQMWGISASDSITGYKAWGGPPRTSDFNALDGTIVPCAAAGSLPFAPEETLAVLRHLRAAHGARLWQRYGFVDAFNPHTDWVNPDVLGVDLGISLVQAENLRTRLIWSTFMQAPEAQRAIRRAGLLSTRRRETADEYRVIRQLAAQSAVSIAMTPVDERNAGLLLTAAIAALQLDLWDQETTTQRVRAILNAVVDAPRDVDARAQYTAGLIVVAQSLPGLAAETSARLATWMAADEERTTCASANLGAQRRLYVFLQLALNGGDGAAWKNLQRTTEPVGSVHLLAPAAVADQYLPSLWLDERAVVTGTSAGQLAYHQLTESETAAGHANDLALPDDLLTACLWLDHFPHEVAARLADSPTLARWFAGAPATDHSVWLITCANLLAEESVRQLFQRDPRVGAARRAITEFDEAAFGEKSSLVWRHELAGPPRQTPERDTTAVAAHLPRNEWSWITVAGLQFKDSSADVREGDPALEMRFAFTWDERFLYLHAEVMDSPADAILPRERHRRVELYVDPDHDGLVWANPDDFQFVCSRGVDDGERFFEHEKLARARTWIRETGYIVEARVPWSQLGVEPRAGLELRATPAVVAGGAHEWEPALKLTWRYHLREDGRADLGLVRLR